MWSEKHVQQPDLEQWDLTRVTFLVFIRHRVCDLLVFCSLWDAEILIHVTMGILSLLTAAGHAELPRSTFHAAKQGPAQVSHLLPPCKS